MFRACAQREGVPLNFDFFGKQSLFAPCLQQRSRRAVTTLPIRVFLGANKSWQPKRERREEIYVKRMEKRKRDWKKGKRVGKGRSKEIFSFVAIE